MQRPALRIVNGFVLYSLAALGIGGRVGHVAGGLCCVERASPSVLEMLATGDSVADVLEAFPSLRREQVLVCVDHAARLMGNQYSLERVA
jgi:uncharacterized protein (DUF433 family)